MLLVDAESTRVIPKVASRPTYCSLTLSVLRDDPPPTPEKIVEIRQLYVSGNSMARISHELNYDLFRVYEAINGLPHIDWASKRNGKRKQRDHAGYCTTQKNGRIMIVYSMWHETRRTSLQLSFDSEEEAEQFRDAVDVKVAASNYRTVYFEMEKIRQKNRVWNRHALYKYLGLQPTKKMRMGGVCPCENGKFRLAFQTKTESGTISFSHNFDSAEELERYYSAEQNLIDEIGIEAFINEMQSVRGKNRFHLLDAIAKRLQNYGFYSLEEMETKNEN